MVFGIDLSHRLLPLPFLVCVCGDTRHARDDEQGIGNRGRDAQIAADCGNRAVDVDRRRPAMLVGMIVQDHLDGPNHLNVLGLDFEFEGHLKEPRGAWVAGVKAMPEPWRNLTRCDAFPDDLLGCGSETHALADESQPAIEKLHAGFDVTAMIAAEPEHAGCHAGA